MSVSIDPPTLSDYARFVKKCKANMETECWEWQGFRMPLGYGQFGHKSDGKNQMLYAHRVSYTWFVGPIPDGLTIDHLCRNPRCVCPWHLEPVTNAENIRRAAAVVTHCKHGHEFTEANTYRNKSTGRRECRACNARRGRELRAKRRTA